MSKTINSLDVLRLLAWIIRWDPRWKHPKGFYGGTCDQTSNNSSNSRFSWDILDLAQCDFSLFPELAHRLQFRRFQYADEFKSTSQADLKDLSKNEFQKCFDDLYK
ncbi:hypothetical protein TNCV_1993381 [Trichonephila clavipes]|nr:hypothetical protein TNCV_1993381 [Trichonephila clavipes]